MEYILRSLLAIFSICFISFLIGCLLDKKFRSIPLVPVFKSLILQILLAFFLLKVNIFRNGLLNICSVVLKLKEATEAGASFVFGYLGGGALPFATLPNSNSFIFTFKVLPMILVINAIAMILFHYNILPTIIRFFSLILGKILSIGGVLGIFASAKIFLDQAACPLLIKPYLTKLTVSEMFSLLTLSMATAASTIILIYAEIISPILPDALGHIITVSIISVPSALTISRLIIAQDARKNTQGDMVIPYKFDNIMDAMNKGALEGMQILWSLTATLLVTIALLYIINLILATLPNINGSAISIERILGFCLRPLAWLMGASWAQAGPMGEILGIKITFNELIAYMKLASLPNNILDQDSILLLAYSLCGFGALSSIAINLGVFNILAPKRKDVSKLATIAVFSGSLASCLSASIALAISRLF